MMAAAFHKKQQRQSVLPYNVASVDDTSDGCHISIDVVNGDLTQENTDAIVNIINTEMNMNRGRLNKALSNACGPQVQQECNQLGSQPPGSAVITSGGHLNVPHIIHIVPGSSDKRHLQECLEGGLYLADHYRLQSISIPAIGTGNFKLSATDSAQLIFEALGNVCASFCSLSEVRIVVYQENMVEAFQQEQQKHSMLRCKLAPVHSAADGSRISIDIVNGDLTQENTDAIVNIINTDMNMNRGRLNKALANACGPQVQQECNQLGSQPPGSAVMTSGGNLTVPHIIHIVPGSRKKLLQECLEEGLRLADQNRFQSIAIPAIGTGNFKLSATDSAKLIFQALGNVCASFCSLSEVRIVVYQENMVQAFQQEQQKHSMLRCKLAPVHSAADGSRISIDVVNGDLTQENTDAIVNIINTEMNMNRGRLNKALSNACGPQVQQECNQLGSQPPGSAVITSGGHLNVPHIIHIVPGSSDKWHLQECLEGGLYLADHYRLQSISIPAIGTGNFKLSATDSAQLIFEALGNVCASFCSLSEVRIVVYQENMVEAFQQEQQKHLMLPCKLAPVHSAADGSRISIDVVNGDLTQENTDAIVNIINTDMNMNRGRLNKALANACGPQVQQECNQLGSQPPGSAVITSGGNLNVPHIVHIVPGSSDKKHLQECLEEGLRLADKCRVQSISIPAIGTGNFRLSATKSAKLVFKALRNVIGSFVNISKVRIVVFDGSLIQAFQDEMTRLDTQYVPHGSSSRAPAIDKSCQPTVRAWEQLISKMVEWSYESNGRKTAFDLRANAKLEMAHSKKHSTEQVTVREKEFIVNMETLNGRCYRDGERIKIYREPNEGEHCCCPYLKGVAEKS